MKTKIKVMGICSDRTRAYRMEITLRKSIQLFTIVKGEK